MFPFMYQTRKAETLVFPQSIGLAPAAARMCDSVAALVRGPVCVVYTVWCLQQSAVEAGVFTDIAWL